MVAVVNINATSDYTFGKIVADFIFCYKWELLQVFQRSDGANVYASLVVFLVVMGDIRVGALYFTNNPSFSHSSLESAGNS